MGIDSTTLARLEVVLAKKLRQEMMTLGYPNGKKLPALKLVLLLGLLLFHFLARQQTARTMPGKYADFYRSACNYFQGYRVSLSLLAGQGFRRLALPGEAGRSANRHANSQGNVVRSQGVKPKFLVQEPRSDRP